MRSGPPNRLQPGDRATARQPEALLARVLGLLAGVAILVSAVGSALEDRPLREVDELGRDPGPPVPRTETAPARPGTPEAVLQRSTLYAAGGLPPVECPAPGLPDTTDEAQRLYHTRIFGCLVEAWEAALTRAGLAMGDPQLYVFSEPGTSPCGSFRPATGQVLAFYCPVNQTMYVDVPQLAGTVPVQDHIAYGLVLAHEYGHHAQHVAGILTAQAQLAYESPELELELSRRTETQASCFAGLFLSSIEHSYPIDGPQLTTLRFYAYNFFGDSPDDPDSQRTHGSPQSQGAWIERGFVSNDTGVCNTYVVASAEVD